MYTGQFDLLRQEAVSFGTRSEEALACLLPKTADAKAIIVTARSLADAHETEALKASLGSVCRLHFSDVKEHAPFANVLELVRAIRDVGPDEIFVIGGGSAIDTTKVALLCEAADVTDPADMPPLAQDTMAGGRAELQFPTRYTAVPTTLSGAEFGVIAGAVDETTQIKNGFRSQWMCAKHVHYDPYLARRTPEWLWLSTGVRAIDHAVETILSSNHNPYASALATQALPLLISALERTKQNPDDVQARQDAQFGVWLAAVGIGRVLYGASHGVGHQLGAVAGVPHGYTSCVLLPAVLEYNASEVGDRYGPIAAALGLSDTARVPEGMRDFLRRIGMPVNLNDVNVAASDVPKIAELSLQNPFVQANPRPLTEATQIQEILSLAS